MWAHKYRSRVIAVDCRTRGLSLKHLGAQRLEPAERLFLVASVRRE
jgi:hypothetical protein